MIRAEDCISMIGGGAVLHQRLPDDLVRPKAVILKQANAVARWLADQYKKIGCNLGYLFYFKIISVIV